MADGRPMVPTPVLVVIGGAIGAAVTSSGGRNATGFVIGLVLGAGIGALIAVALHRRAR